jgi:hypothetical protein
MEATKINEEAARQIINILAEKRCTVNECMAILQYVGHTIKDHATVQKVENKLFDCEQN